MKANNLIFLFITLSIIFIVYSTSLGREWQLFDEKGMYVDEKLFPIPTTIAELFEVISTYAFKYHIDSQNAFFSNIITVRSNLLGAILNIFVMSLINGNAYYLHLLELFLHLLNTTFVWFIFYFLLKNQNAFIKSSSIFSTFFTLIWALHPANTEAVLLGTNWPSLLTYTFCFAFFLYCLLKIFSENFKNTKSETFLLSIFYFLSILISEYSYTLPFILFFVSFAFAYKKTQVFSRSLLSSLSLIFPFFLGLLFFIFYNLIRNQVVIGNINFSFERLFWLTPQIFLHFFKMLFYPKELSLYQSNLVYLANSLFDPYVIFAALVFLLFLILPLIFFKRFVFLLTYGFIFSLLPFLHLISPTYCLFADRYIYFPIFILLFFLMVLIHESPLQKYKKPIAAILCIIIFVSTIRTAYRLNDWKNSFSLYSSSIKLSKDKLFKGKIYSVLGYYFDLMGEKENMKNYMLLSIKNLKGAIKELKIKKEKEKSAPETLKIYGLDLDSQITTSAYTISNIRLNHFHEGANKILDFYEPYIKNNLINGGNSQIDMYAKLLLRTNQKKKALSILEFAQKKYPFSPTIIYTLSNLYLKNHDIEKASGLINYGFKLYPTYPRILIRLIKLSELKNDPISIARYEYLLGLRTHSKQGYQKSAQVYLFHGKLNEAKKALDKLLLQEKEDPTTLLLLSKYYYLRGDTISHEK